MTPQNNKGRAAGTRATPKEKKVHPNAITSNCLVCLHVIEVRPTTVGVYPADKTRKNGTEIILRYEICKSCTDKMMASPAAYEQWTVRLQVLFEPVAALIANRDGAA